MATLAKICDTKIMRLVARALPEPVATESRIVSRDYGAVLGSAIDTCLIFCRVEQVL
tara:strand:- start:1052 stop:1222 length:171 start_codon:yes stop_codon:yes gene_type:complete